MTSRMMNKQEVESLTYLKALTNEERAKATATLVEKLSNLSDLRIERKEKMKEYADEIKALEVEIDQLVQELKEDSREVTENCVKVVDAENTTYYNAEGLEVYKRRSTLAERQMSIEEGE